ncbi:MAG TPA: type II secretion system F family protein [Candidatus Omnitrophota bacterium]|nr:type II secretion system F family protein [Candidatus Omnitrophota bacterium]
MLFVALVCVIGALVLLSMAVVPILLDIFVRLRVRREQEMEKKLDTVFDAKKMQSVLKLAYIFPLVFAIVGFVAFGSLIFAIVGAVLGLFIPNLIMNLEEKKRRAKFNAQILDAIMILSSSLKGGLSLLQALEVLQEEIPVPMSQEIGLVVRENKMGVSLEESLRHLDKRMKLDDLTLVVNSIQVARETGGDLTKVFSRLTTTIRDNRKLKDSIRTLTMQGRMQGVIMSALPFFFTWWVYSFNKEHFDIMFKSETGRMLMIAAIVLQAVGMFLIKKFSTINI